MNIDIDKVVTIFNLFAKKYTDSKYNIYGIKAKSPNKVIFLKASTPPTDHVVYCPTIVKVGNRGTNPIKKYKLDVESQEINTITEAPNRALRASAAFITMIF